MDQSIAQKFNVLRTKMFRWLQLALPATSLQYPLLEVQLEILGLLKLLRKGPRSKKTVKCTTQTPGKAASHYYFDFRGGKGGI